METNTIIYIIIAALVIISAILFIIIRKKTSSKNGKEVVSKTAPESLKLKLDKTKIGLLGKLAEVVKLRGKVDDTPVHRVDVRTSIGPGTHQVDSLGSNRCVFRRYTRTG